MLNASFEEKSMYFVIIALLMFVLPITSILIDLIIFKNPAGVAALIGK